MRPTMMTSIGRSPPTRSPDWFAVGLPVVLTDVRVEIAMGEDVALLVAVGLAVCDPFAVPRTLTCAVAVTVLDWLRVE